jgi:hypothetical protein
LPYLGRWREIFEAERLGIVLFEDIVRDAVATTRGFYGFLGVDPSHVPAFTGVVNPGGLPKRPLVHKLLSDKRLRETARRVLPAHPGPDRPQPLGLAGAMTGNVPWVVTWIVPGRVSTAAPSCSPKRRAAAMIRAAQPALQPGDCLR